MRVPTGVLLIGQLWLVGCGSSPDSAEKKSGEKAPAAGSEECNLLTAADVQAVTGTVVQRIERNPAVGAGGTCLNFSSADGQGYLGVNRLTSAADYRASVSSAPEDLYPTREALPGLGDEAVLLKGPSGVRYLVARKGSSGVVLFPMGKGYYMSDQQLRDLAAKALAR